MFSLVEQDTVKSVLQNIRIILSTPRGTVPHRPDFAVDYRDFIDNPTPLSIGKLKATIVDAIETYEPRAKVKAIDIRYKEIGHADVILTIQIEDEELTWTYALQ
ncbi:GPW/gp25 family protein [Pampinifervens florentissimum]|uniref:GPW/gp25 family protein n=1 Tax=Pampinifervens florentissimum TaxID=1632019 RepID=UPI0013B47AFC|nr:GPW/gp25 family protein [Hydrogenobacter sp. T-8]QID32294.1 hypothetical protein G3M65_00270 [Hydrogenobacter sp. T-8]